MSTWDLKMGGSLEQRGSIGGGAIKIKAVYDKQVQEVQIKTLGILCKYKDCLSG